MALIIWNEKITDESYKIRVGKDTKVHWKIHGLYYTHPSTSDDIVIWQS